MTIALVGASGLIGSAVRSRLARSQPVRTIGRHVGADMVADLARPDTVASLSLEGCSALIHCAGIVDEDFADPERAFRQATLGMSALVARAKSAGINRFLYVSSAHVYGRFVGSIEESSPPNPLHDYAIAHYASEQILRRATDEGFRGAVVRPCAVFGIPPDVERFRRWTLIPFGFPISAVGEGTIALASRGLQRRNFVGTEDIAAAVSIWLDDVDALSFSVINPIGNQTMTVLEFAQLCARAALSVTGRECAVTRPEGLDPAPDSFDYRSLDSRFYGSAPLEETILHLTRLLAQRSAQPRAE